MFQYSRCWTACRRGIRMKRSRKAMGLRTVNVCLEIVHHVRQEQLPWPCYSSGLLQQEVMTTRPGADLRDTIKADTYRASSLYSSQGSQPTLLSHASYRLGNTRSSFLSSAKFTYSASFITTYFYIHKRLSRIFLHNASGTLEAPRASSQPFSMLLCCTCHSLHQSRWTGQLDL